MEDFNPMDDALDWLLEMKYVEMAGFDEYGELLYQITPAGEIYLADALKYQQMHELFVFKPEQMN